MQPDDSTTATEATEAPAGDVDQADAAAVADPAGDEATEAADDEPAPNPVSPPSLGRIVHYRLNQADAAAINTRRGGRALQLGVPVSMLGNEAASGQVFPAKVVRTWGGTTVNLQVTLDGDDAYWAASRQHGDGDGQWFWPPMV
jgi:hypothetical protein